MPRSPKILILCCLSLLLFSCKQNEREKQLDAREKLLSEKENVFSQKEAEFDALLKMRDSLYAKKIDSVIIPAWPDALLGKWNGKVICTESNCSDYVIGDQRTDVWEFSENGKTVLAKVTDRSGNLKVYSGSYSNSELNLQSKEDSTSTRKTEINLIWNNLQANSLKGARKVTANNNCVAKFTLELEKSKSKL